MKPLKFYFILFIFTHPCIPSLKMEGKMVK
jgi:hypothetical protein